jgi:hypothetical protein
MKDSDDLGELEQLLHGQLRRQLGGNARAARRWRQLWPRELGVTQGRGRGAISVELRGAISIELLCRWRQAAVEAAHRRWQRAASEALAVAAAAEREARRARDAPIYVSDAQTGALASYGVF